MNNKVALVTGGARRLGKDISINLSKTGYDIILNYNKSSKQELDDTIAKIKESGVNVLPLRCDVSKVDEIKNMFQIAGKEFKSLDLLINNAAIFEHIDFFEIDEKTFDKFIDTNLKSTFFCCQEAAKIMLNSDKTPCRIINIASLGAIENWTGYMPYSISKAGVVKFTQLLAKKLAPKILVNAIAPGTVLIDNDENETINFTEEKKYPMKRFAKANDITTMINYLAETNVYITGQTFVVDGGRSL